MLTFLDSYIGGWGTLGEFTLFDFMHLRSEVYGKGRISCGLESVAKSSANDAQALHDLPTCDDWALHQYGEGLVC